MPLNEVWSRITAKVNVCGVEKRSQQKVRENLRALKRAVLNHPDHLATHIMETITAGEVPSVTRSCNSGVSFRNRSDC